MTDRFTQLAKALRDDLEDKLIKAAESGTTDLNEEVVRKHVVERITAQRDAIIKRVLGVDTKWSQPEISDGSPLRAMIDEEINAMLRERVRGALAKKLGKLDDRRKLRAQIDAGIATTLKQRVSWTVDDMAREYASATVKTMTKRAIARIDAALAAE